MLVYSPSNMAAYVQCPRKFQAQYMTEEIKWQPTAQKVRGSNIHSSIEHAIKVGWDNVVEFESGMNLDFVKKRVEIIRGLMAEGAAVYTEHDLAITKDRRPTTFWSDDAYIRCKADVVIVPQDSDRIVLLDWKTGKHWDTEDFQLRVEAYMSYFIYKRPVIQYSYIYVDEGDTQSGIIDLKVSVDKVRDVVDLLKEMDNALINNDFAPKANKFCKWCGLHNTPGCKL